MFYLFFTCLKFSQKEFSIFGLTVDAFTRNIQEFDLGLGVKVTQIIDHYPLHHVTFTSAKFEVATSNDSERHTITRIVTDRRMDRRTRD